MAALEREIVWQLCGNCENLTQKFEWKTETTSIEGEKEWKDENSGIEIENHELGKSRNFEIRKQKRNDDFEPCNYNGCSFYTTGNQIDKKGQKKVDVESESKELTTTNKMF